MDNNGATIFGYNSYSYHLTWYSSRWYYACGSGESSFNGTQCTDLQVVDFNNANNKVVMNGVEYASTSGTSSAGGNLTLFCRGGTDCLCKAKLYYLKIYNRSTNTLVRDFVPAKSNEAGHTNEVCLYDNVTQTYFYNQGTGTFSYGEDVVSNTASVGDTLGLSSSAINLVSTTKQWQKRNNTTIEEGKNFSLYTKNQYASSAYSSIVYDSDTNTNTVTMCGVDGHERVAYQVEVFPGSTVNFSLKYKATSSLGGQPYMYIGSLSDFNVYGDNYDNPSYVYAKQLLPATSQEFTEYSCSYTNTTSSSQTVHVGWNSCRCSDGVTVTYYLKDMSISLPVFEDITGATSSTYTVQTGDNAIRCALQGIGDNIGSTNSNITTIN